MTTIFRASIYYRPDKPLGVGRNEHERYKCIVGGWRGEIISCSDETLRDRMIYTGVCASRQEARLELVDHLKAAGLHGLLTTR